MAETSFHWLWQILMSTSDELNLAQGRSGFVGGARQLKCTDPHFQRKMFHKCNFN